jgi:hypothetical protein
MEQITHNKENPTNAGHYQAITSTATGASVIRSTWSSPLIVYLDMVDSESGYDGGQENTPNGVGSEYIS